MPDPVFVPKVALRQRRVSATLRTGGVDPREILRFLVHQQAAGIHEWRHHGVEILSGGVVLAVVLPSRNRPARACHQVGELEGGGPTERPGTRL